MSQEYFSEIKTIMGFYLHLRHLRFSGNRDRKHILPHTFNINNHNHFVFLCSLWNKRDPNVFCFFRLNNISLRINFKFLMVKFPISWNSEIVSKANGGSISQLYFLRVWKRVAYLSKIDSFWFKVKGWSNHMSYKQNGQLIS